MNKMKLNPFLETLPTYQPGRPIDEVARELNLPARVHSQGGFQLKIRSRPASPRAALEALQQSIA